MTVIDLNSLTGTATYTLATSSTYTFTGTANCTLLTIYMATGVNAILDGGSGTTFNCPVIFNTLASSESSSQGNGRTLTFINNFIFNYHVNCNTYGNNSVHTSRINFGSVGTSANMAFYNTNGLGALTISGLGGYTLNNSGSIMNVYLAPTVEGIHQYATHGIFTVTGGTIYAIVGSAMQNEEVIVLSTYMIMDPPFTIRFDVPITTELSSIPANTPIIINSAGVVIEGTPFGTFAVTINEDCDLTLDSCSFNPLSTDPAFNITGPGSLNFTATMLDEDENVIPNTVTLLGNAGIMSTHDDPPVTVNGAIDVYVPAGFIYNNSFTEPDGVQNFDYYIDASGNYNFATFTTYPLNVFIDNNSTAVVTINANAGCAVNISDTSTIEFTSSNLYAGDTLGTALQLNLNGENGTCLFDSSSNNITHISAGDGLTLLAGANGNGMTGYLRYYLNANNENAGTWNFDTTTYSTNDLTSICNNGVYLNTNCGHFTVNVNYETQLPMYTSSTGNAIPDSITVSRATLAGTVGNASDSQVNYIFGSSHVDLQVNFYDSSTFTTPLIITSGTVCASSSIYQAIFNIRNGGTWPYSGDLESPANAQIFLFQGPSYDFSTTPSDLITNDGTIPWFLSTIYPVNSTSDGTYHISHIDSAGLTFANYGAVVPTLYLCSSYPVTFDITSGNSMNIAGGSMLSNQNQTTSPVIIMGSLGTLHFDCTVTLNVYGTSALSLAEGSNYTGGSMVIINYYANTYDFSVNDRSLEYSNHDGGIHLKSSDNYTFSGATSLLNFLVSGNIHPTITGSTFTNGLTINTTSCETTTITTSSYTFNNQSGILIIGTGHVCADHIDFYLNDITAIYYLIAVGTDDNNGSATLDIRCSTISGSGDYTYGFYLFTSGIVNTHDVTLNATDYNVLWPSLANTTSDAPYISANNYVALSFDPTTTVAISHSTDAYTINDSTISSYTFAFASGNVNSDASNVAVTIIPESYQNATTSSDTYSGIDGALTELFTSDVFSSKYFGALMCGNQSYTYSGLSNSVRKGVATLQFASDPNIYLGNASFQLTFIPSDESFGPNFYAPYTITDTVSLPCFHECPSYIDVMSGQISNNTATFTLSRGLALPVYIYPTSSADSLFTYRKNSNHCDYLSYTDYYAAYADNLAYVQYIPINTTSVTFYMKFVAVNEIYDSGATLNFTFHPLANRDDNTLFTISDISIDNNSSAYTYPLISTDGESAILSRSVDIEADSDGTFNKNSSYDASNISYTIGHDNTLYVKSPYNTFDDTTDHILLITGLTDGLTYTYPTAPGMTDNNDGTATMVFTGNSTSFNAFLINVHTTANLSDYTFGSTITASFSIIDTTALQTYGDASGTNDVSGTTISFDFNIPQIVMVGIGNLCDSGSDFANMHDGGDLNGNFSKGGDVTITIMTVGSVNQTLVFPFDVNSNLNSDLMAYSPNPFNLCFSSGHRHYRALSFTQDNRISGNGAYYTLTPGTVTLNGDNIDVSTITQIELDDNSNNHEMTFAIGLGNELGISSFTDTSTDTTQTPASYSESDILAVQPISQELYMVVGVNTNSIPYLTNSDTSAYNTIRVNYYITGASTTDASGTPLTIGTDIFVYDNINGTGSGNISYVLINDSTWNSDNTLYIAQGDIGYNFINIYYYLSDACDSTASMNSHNDYHYLHNLIVNKVKIVQYDFTQATSGTTSSRYVSIGDWILQSNNVGDLIFKYNGTIQNDTGAGVGSTFTLHAPTTLVHKVFNVEEP